MLVRLTAGSVFSLPDEVRVRVKLTLNGPYMDLTWTLHGLQIIDPECTLNRCIFSLADETDKVTDPDMDPYMSPT